MNAIVHKTSTESAPPTRSSTPLNPAGNILKLIPQQYAYIRNGCGWNVHARRGVLWLTQDGDIRDVVLQAGESFVLDRKGPALLSALDDVEVCVSLHAVGCNAQERSVATPQDMAPAFA